MVTMLVQYKELIDTIEYLQSSKDIHLSNGKYSRSRSFHSHDKYEIYLFLSGDVEYFIENKVYSMFYGDLFTIRSDEFHSFIIKSDKIYERISLRFDPLLAVLFSLPGFNLLECFDARPKGEKNHIRLDNKSLDEVLMLLGKLKSVLNHPVEGQEVLKLSYLLELLVIVNRLFISAPHDVYALKPSPKLVPILDYIEKNIAGELSLQTLGKQFYMNSSYLSWLFKSHTGVNVHEYITFKRIALAKNLLNAGSSVTEACYRSGFRDYANFIRLFKKHTGIPPGHYAKRIQTAKLPPTPML